LEGRVPTDDATLHCHQPSSDLYKTRLRTRQQGWQRFLQKWDLDQHLEIGTGTRNLDSSISDWFVGNVDGSNKGRTDVVENALEYASLRPAAGVASMRLRTRESAPSRKSNLTDRVSSIGSFLNPTADPIPTLRARLHSHARLAVTMDFVYRPWPSVRVGSKTSPKILKTAERVSMGYYDPLVDNRGRPLSGERTNSCELSGEGVATILLPTATADATHLRRSLLKEGKRVP
jgi:hypothetical protein